MEIPSLGVYVHWPFCEVKCPYCDFNSHVRENIDFDSWNDSLLGELRESKKHLGDRQLETIFFGGGTPSLMPPYIVKNVIDEIKSLWGFSSDVEVSMEANPGSFDESRFTEYASSGVTRVSLGVQSFNDENLRFLGRIHNVEDSKRAIRFAGEVFNRMSIDMIYGLPEQSLEDWRSELSWGIDFAKKCRAKHVSLYQLTIEKGTYFDTAHRLKKFTMPGEEKQYDFFSISNKVTEERGLAAYEVSNYAERGEESRHNVRVWQYRDYLGIGPGAHSRFQIDGKTYARSNYRLVEKWLSHQKINNEGVEFVQEIEDEVACEEAIMMGLRLYRGISKSDIERRFSGSWGDMFSSEKLQVLIEGGDLQEDSDYIMASKQGISRLNQVVLYFVDAMELDFWRNR